MSKGVGRGIALGLGVVLVAAACGPLSATAPSTRAAHADRFAAAVARSTDLGPIERGASVSVRLALDDAAADARAADILERTRLGSASYGSSLTEAQYAASFGPRPGSVAALRDALGRRGLDLVSSPGLHVVEAVGPAEAVEAAFGVSVHRYVDKSGRPFIAALSSPRIPPDLAGLVTRIDPITDHGWIHVEAPSPAVPPGGLSPQDLAIAYDFKQLWDLGIDGTGETIVIFGTDGHRQKDLDDFADRFGLPRFTVTEMFNSKKREAPGGEETMDIEAVHAVAPGARILVYSPQTQRIVDALPAVTAMTRDNPGAIQTHSWGFCEDILPPALARSWLETLQKAADLGESVFVATGDSGGLDCPPDDWSSPPDPDWTGIGAPASIPYAIAVGGTRLSLREDRSYYNETVWTEPARTVGSTGGISDVFSAGQWQDGPGVRGKEWNGQRMVPDVSMVADNMSGLSILVGGRPQQGGGTSLGTPIWAGITALMDQYLKQKGLRPVGFATPAFYAIAAGAPPFKPAFHDVTVGANLVYRAGPGYDLATGLGTPHVWDLVRDIEALQRQAR